LWNSWDLAVETMLSQLPELLVAERAKIPYDYQHSSFFSEQLTAFEVYLAQDASEQKIPEQLPVVLQVLLSQVHRLRALILLSKFLDLGPWAVNLALSIGIFPYVLKLLQSQALELKPVMVFIWARILAVDPGCQGDLLKDNGYQYFVQILNPTGAGILSVVNVSEHRAMCAFIVAMFCRKNQQAQNVCLSENLIKSCLDCFKDTECPLLRQWACLCLSSLWENFPEAKWMAIKCSATQELCSLVVDCVAEVRAAMLHALTSFLGMPDVTPQIAQIEESITSLVLIMAYDGNTMVRKELVVYLSTFIFRYKSRFLVTAFEHMLEEKKNIIANAELKHRRLEQMHLVDDDQEEPLELDISSNNIFGAVWKEVLILSVDPQPEVAENACIIVDYVYSALLQSPLGKHATQFVDFMRVNYPSSTSSNSSYVEVAHPSNDKSRPPTPPTPSKSENYFTSSLKRTASVAASIMSLPFTSAHSSQQNTPKGSGENTPRSSKKYSGVKSKMNNELNRPPNERDHYHVPASYPALQIPLPRAYTHSPIVADPQIPIQSKFFDWAVEYFREPQMAPAEADEPGSTDYNERLWRRNRNDKIISKTQPLKEIAGSTEWNKPKGFWDNRTQPVKLCWHQFEDQLIVTDDKDGVS